MSKLLPRVVPMRRNQRKEQIVGHSCRPELSRKHRVTNAASGCRMIEVRVREKVTDALQCLAKVECEVLRVFVEETEHV